MPTSPKFHYFGFAYVNAKIVIRTVFVKAIDRNDNLLGTTACHGDIGMEGGKEKRREGDLQMVY